MKAFGYWRDPLCCLSVGLYAINRWIVKPHAGPGFFHDHFNDLLLIPAALPLILWVQRKLTLRKNNAPPNVSEIAMHLIVWTLICEVIGPRFVAHATADWRDAAAYAGGAVIAGVVWNYSSLLKAITAS